MACGASPKAPANATVTTTPSVAMADVEDHDRSGWTDSAAPVPVSSQDASWGARDALVTLVVFSDFQCPYCAKLARTFEALRKDYGTADLRIVWKNEPLPFHANAKPAAIAARGVFELAGSKAFWAFHDKAFGAQSELGTESYVRWAQESGVTDIAAFRAGLEQQRWAAAVANDHALAEKLGVHGTPATFINGTLLGGAQPVVKFKEAIDEELRKARAKVASGTPRTGVYVAMATENFEAPPKKDDREEEPEEDDKAIRNVPIGNSPVRGDSAKALVTIIEFSDFQCPFCARVEPTLDRVREAYGAQVRVVWKHHPLPFHPHARPAALLSLLARSTQGDAGFWRAHDKLFEGQKNLEDDRLLALAKELGLNETKAKDAIAGRNKSLNAALQADQALASDVDANGTPTFFINGRLLAGAQPYEAFSKVVDEQLARAKALQAAGVPQAKLYEVLVRDGKAAPGEPEPSAKGAPAEAKGSPSQGPANAPVTLQVFSDYQCPFCSKVEDTLKEVRQMYPGKLRLVWRDYPLPFHENAALAAEAAREVLRQKGTAAFWKFHDALFADQAHLQQQDLEAKAKELGCNMQQFAEALSSHRHARAVTFDMDAASAADVRGTPAIFVNDYLIVGAQPLRSFQRAIDKALKDAPKAKKARLDPLSGPAPKATLKYRTMAQAPRDEEFAGGTPAALKVEDLLVGTGAEAKAGQNVRVHYIGTLTNGAKFDASRDHGSEGFSFALGTGTVIKGWDQGVSGMRVGGKRKLTIPPELGYGARGAGNAIPPNSTLIFEVELLGIETDPEGGLRGQAP